MNIGIDISNTVLYTERLTLRPWRMADVDDMYEYASVDGVGQMAGWTPHKNKEESMEIVRMFIEEKKTFALEYQGKVIGSIGIEEYEEADMEEYHHLKGREIGVDFLCCTHYLKNIQSARVQEKCGFQYVKHVQRTHEAKMNVLTKEDNS